MKRTLIAACVALSACSPERPCDVEVDGVCFASAPDGGAPVPDLERLTATLRAARAWWGLSPDDLKGWQVQFYDHPLDGAPDGYMALGRTYPGQAIDVYLPDGNIEVSALWHEIGHAAIGDYDHRSAAWSKEQTAMLLWSDR